ncbi:MAG: hypothetical protein L3J13_06000, partial [Devosiaceae bacterium]|nr:hypothetical protein [Devosiaceae bacterium]
MAISGPEAMASLDDAVRDIRRDESDIGKRLSRSVERMGKIRENEAELCRQLAKLRLSPKMQQEIEGRLIPAEKQARQVFKTHAAESEAVAKTLKAQDEVIAQLAKSRHVALQELGRAQEKLKGISSRVADLVAADPQYADLRANVDELQTIANESLKKTEQAEADQEQKGRPYREDPLFMYLWDAGYGTSSYKANNLARWLDGLVAKMIRFHDARPNFAMLNQIPVRLREHAERQVVAAEEAEEKIDDIEARAVKKAGGDPITKAIEEAQQKLKKLDLDMLKGEDKRD